MHAQGCVHVAAIAVVAGTTQTVSLCLPKENGHSSFMIKAMSRRPLCSRPCLLEYFVSIQCASALKNPVEIICTTWLSASRSK